MSVLYGLKRYCLCESFCYGEYRGGNYVGRIIGVRA